MICNICISQDHLQSWFAEFAPEGPRSIWRKLKCSPASGAKDKLQHAVRLVRPHLLGFPASHGAGKLLRASRCQNRSGLYIWLLSLNQGAKGRFPSRRSLVGTWNIWRMMRMNLSSNITQRIWFILVLYQRDIQRERGNLQAVNPSWAA